MNNINNLKKRDLYLTKQIQKMQQIISNAPAGKLYAREKRGIYRYSKYIHLPDGSKKEVYLEKNHPDLIPLAEKMYAESVLKDLRREKKLVEQEIQYLEKEQQEPIFLKNHPGIQCLLSPGMRSLPEKAQIWSKQDYPRKQNHPEQLRYTTVIKGLMVRSKAEADIISQFYHYGIPFRYEEILTIEDKKTSIDFTLLNVRTNSIYYWDHRGLPDDPHYLEKTHYCETLFQKMDIIPWVNLIVTTETKDHPLDIQWVKTLIEYYLL